MEQVLSKDQCRRGCPPRTDSFGLVVADDCGANELKEEDSWVRGSRVDTETCQPMACFRVSERRFLDFGAGQRDLDFATEVVQVNRGGFVSCRSTRVGFVVEQVNRRGFVSCRMCSHLEVDQVNRRGFVSCHTHEDFGL
jgi:hypothetical protein